MSATQERFSVTIDADWAVVVRAHYEREEMRHGKDSHWAWVADRVEGP